MPDPLSYLHACLALFNPKKMTLPQPAAANNKTVTIY